MRQESDRAANRLVDLEARAAREAAARAERSDRPDRGAVVATIDDPYARPVSDEPRQRGSPPGVLDGLAHDPDDIFPDANSQAMAPTWWSDAKSFERAFSGAAAP